jgi:hypothetical protein
MSIYGLHPSLTWGIFSPDHNQPRRLASGNSLLPSHQLHRQPQLSLPSIPHPSPPQLALPSTPHPSHVVVAPVDFLCHSAIGWHCHRQRDPLTTSSSIQFASTSMSSPYETSSLRAPASFLFKICSTESKTI